MLLHGKRELRLQMELRLLLSSGLTIKSLSRWAQYNYKGLISERRKEDSYREGVVTMETVVRVMRLLALKMQGGYEPMDAGHL